MRTVKVYAANLKVGDVMDGMRIKAVHRHARRHRQKGHLGAHKLARTGVLVVAPNPNGYKLETFRLEGHRKVTVKRPLYNMKNRRKPKATVPAKPESPFKVGDIVRSTINTHGLWKVTAVRPNGNLDVRCCQEDGTMMSSIMTYTQQQPDIFVKCG